MTECMGLNEDANVISTNLCSYAYGRGKVIFVADLCRFNSFVFQACKIH